MDAIALASGQAAQVAGKPHQAMADLVRFRLANIEPSQMLMVGDRVSTDGQFAKVLGCKFALVLSGVTLDSSGSSADVVGRALCDIVDQM